VTPPPDRVIAVDWSGAAGAAAQRRAIVAAVVDGGSVTALHAGRTRAEVAALLPSLVHGRRAVIGLDFAFAPPTWFQVHLGCPDASAFWARAAAEGEGWLAPPLRHPFWGRRGAPRWRDLADDARAFRVTDLAVESVDGIRPKSYFQVGGAGSVGTGSIRGAPALLALRAAGVAIWPFDAARYPFAVEIYPRLFAGRVAKRRERARRAALAPHSRRVPPRVLARAVAHEDTFDAVIAALGMWDAARQLAALTAREERPIVGASPREGCIWHPHLRLET
jgi:hypothetical protein